MDKQNEDQQPHRSHATKRAESQRSLPTGALRRPGHGSGSRPAQGPVPIREGDREPRARGAVGGHRSAGEGRDLSARSPEDRGRDSALGRTSRSGSIHPELADSQDFIKAQLMGEGLMPSALPPAAAYKEVIKRTSELKSAVEMALDAGDGERDAIASMDSDKILRCVAIRTARQDTLRQLERVVLQRMEVWCKSLGLSSIDLRAAEEVSPAEAEAVKNLLDDLQVRVSALRTRDDFQADLLTRMSSYVNDYISAVVPRSQSYNRRGKTPVLQGGSTFSYRV